MNKVRNRIAKIKPIRRGPYNSMSLVIRAGKTDPKIQKIGVLRLVRASDGYYYTSGPAKQGDTELSLYHYLAGITWSRPL